MLWEILVPTVRRVGGKPYTARYHRVWDARVRELAGGLTIMRPAKGVWTSSTGKVVAERMIPVRIACDEGTIRLVMDLTMEYYDQEAVMAYRVSDHCIIRSRTA